MKNKLIPLTQFVNNIDELVPDEIGQEYYIWRHKQYKAIKNYSAFLSKPLKLEYFVPCVDGYPAEEPEWWYRYCNGASPFMNMDEIIPCQDYREAESKVLFEGFVYNEWDRRISNTKATIFLKDSDTHVFEKSFTEIEWFLLRGYTDVESLLKGRYPITLTPTALKQIYG